MKILITHVYSRDNAGDAAILSVLISELKNKFKNPEIVISTMEDISILKSFENMPLITSFISLTIKKQGRLNVFFNTIYVLLTTIIWIFVYKITKIKINFILKKKLNALLNNFSDSDLIIPVGGGYLRGINNLMSDANLFMLLFPLFIGKLMGKAVILHSQSIGPFGNIFQIYISKIILNIMDLIILRENVSIDLLRKIGVKNNLLIRSIDAGFLFKTPHTVSLLKKLNISDINSNKKIVGITVRQWLDPNEQYIYESEIAKFADYLTLDKKMSVVFIPQVTVDMLQDDDRTVSSRVIDKMKNKTDIYTFNEKFSHYEIKSIYSNLDYIIGTRFHSVIFSLTSFVPAIAIEYEHKTGGIMNDLGLSDWVLKIEDVNCDKLVKIFNKLVIEKGDYLSILMNKLPSYISDANNTIFIIKKAFLTHKLKQN